MTDAGVGECRVSRPKVAMANCGLGCGGEGLGFDVYGLGFGVEGLGFKVLGLRLRV